jgi:KinB signaling pathway activation protein
MEPESPLYVVENWLFHVSVGTIVPSGFFIGGVTFMTLKKWFHLIWTSVVLGIVTAVVVGLVMQFVDQNYQIPLLSAVGFNFVTMAIAGATISVLSQAGFFSYLIVKWIALSILRSKGMWDIIQIALVAVALGDLAYLRYVYYGQGGSFIPYIWLPLIILVVSVAVSYYKMKLTNRSAFIPTLFIMSTITILEAVPALRLEHAASTLFTLVPLMACNAWQVLTLHKIVGSRSRSDQPVASQ